MLTVEEIQKFIRLLGVEALDENIGIREARNQPPRDVYFVRHPVNTEPGKIKDKICYHFHKSDVEIFTNPPWWGKGIIDFDLLPAIEDQIRETLSHAS